MKNRLLISIIKIAVGFLCGIIIFSLMAAARGFSTNEKIIFGIVFLAVIIGVVLGIRNLITRNR